MNFKEAIEALHKGHKVRRHGWPDLIHLRLIKKDTGSTINELIVSYRQECTLFQYDNSIMKSDDWIIDGDEDILVSFPYAIDALKKHKKIRLKEWPRDTYLQADDYNNNLYMFQMTEHPYVPAYPCFISEDWEILE